MKHINEFVQGSLPFHGQTSSVHTPDSSATTGVGRGGRDRGSQWKDTARTWENITKNIPNQIKIIFRNNNKNTPCSRDHTSLILQYNQTYIRDSPQQMYHLIIIISSVF